MAICGASIFHEKVQKAAFAYVKYTERQKYVIHTKPMLNQRLLRWLNIGSM